MGTIGACVGAFAGGPGLWLVELLCGKQTAELEQPPQAFLVYCAIGGLVVFEGIAVIIEGRRRKAG